MICSREISKTQQAAVQEKWGAGLNSLSFLRLFVGLVFTVSVPRLLVPSLRLASVSGRESGRAALHPGLEASAQQRLLSAGSALFYPLSPAGPEMPRPRGAYRSRNPGARVTAPSRVHHRVAA